MAQLSSGTTINSIIADAFPSGTAIVFAQQAAPTGWTKVTTTYNDAALRVVGSATWLGSNLSGRSNFSDIFSLRSISGSNSKSVSGSGVFYENTSSYTQRYNTVFTGTDLNMNIKYVDVIIATKN